MKNESFGGPFVRARPAPDQAFNFLLRGRRKSDTDPIVVGRFGFGMEEIRVEPRGIRSRRIHTAQAPADPD